MKELKLEELTTRQKLGMCMSIFTFGEPGPVTDANVEYALDLIRNHSLGAIWVTAMKQREEVLRKVKETADYPILIMTDAESGFGKQQIGRHNMLATTGDEELAYIFGKVTALNARKMGYNVVCNPILDLCNGNAVCGTTMRSMGSDKEKVARLAIAEAKGMHDGGVLTVGKHYPGGKGDGTIDGHMAENLSMETMEEMIDYNLYPYRQLMKEGLLDGIMTSHCRMPNIDPDFPISLSKKGIGIIRELGFDGFAITDALEMMGVVTRFGKERCKGLAIAGGNDLGLVTGAKYSYEALCKYYDAGLIDDSRLDEAVRRVLEAQHKTLRTPKFEEVTAEDLEKFDRINRNSTYARVDEGVEVKLPKEKKHLFMVLVENGVNISPEGKIAVDTMNTSWYDAGAISRRLEENYPGSMVLALDEFPSPGQNYRAMHFAAECDDVVFITFTLGLTCVGPEVLSTRVVYLMEMMQLDRKISTIVHFGNPYTLENLPHVPRILIGGTSRRSVECTLDVLEGRYPAKGVLTYDVKFQ